MKVIVVSSPTPGAGKTTAVVALGQRLRRAGVAVDYRRLLGIGAEADAVFIASALRLGAAARRVSTFEDIRTKVTADADVLFIEASSEPPSDLAVLGGFAGDSAQLLVVARFQSEGFFESIRDHSGAWPAPSTMVLLSAVPDKGLRQVQNRVVPALLDQRISVIGIIPQDRILLGLTVGELAESLGAEVLCASDQLGLPVEAVMISAMSDEGAEEYFRRIARKAVVAGGDRPDIHMPALATDTSCIVLTEGHDPDPTVFKTADEQGVPLLKVTASTVETLEHISTALANARFRQRHKIARAVALFTSHVDEEMFDRWIGSASREVAR